MTKEFFDRGKWIAKWADNQPAWQGLTDKEDNAIIKKIWIWGNDFPYEKYRIAIEQALKDKNSV
jgi:hypothetical protein